jgi:hypothetical protein
MAEINQISYTFLFWWYIAHIYSHKFAAILQQINIFKEMAMHSMSVVFTVLYTGLEQVQ